ncbi:MAG: hypothetical protein AAF628_34500 [Planctomycetota bacterium]
MTTLLLAALLPFTRAGKELWVANANGTDARRLESSAARDFQAH